MARTFYADLKRDDGTPVTVEFTFSGGSPDSYSPVYGATGGDAAECEIVKTFTDEADVKLTDAEDERMTLHLLETFEEPYDDGDEW